MEHTAGTQYPLWNDVLKERNSEQRALSLCFLLYKTETLSPCVTVKIKRAAIREGARHRASS